MNRIRRPSIALLLALMLTLTGQSMAVARGMPDATGTMVLCTGSGPMSVPVDANGQPTGPAHICPDCAATLFVALADAPLSLLSQDIAGHSLAWPVESALLASAPRRTTHARDPPA